MIRWLILFVVLLTMGRVAEAADHVIPQIDGEWWSVTGNPDLGRYTSDQQQPVDFGIWQAADGTWQIWSCIRYTKCGGHTRLFYRWEGKSLTDTNWKPMGIAMEADTTLGEAAGGLQAPHVFRDGDVYYMVYGDWHRICLAKSDDGKTFHRVLNDKKQPALFSGPYDTARDAMVLKVGNLFYCYYMGHNKDAKYPSAIFCRTSHDLKEWSEPRIVSAGGIAATQCNWYGGDAECPFVVHKDGRFHLFRNQLYGVPSLNTQYTSSNPLNFGVGHDRFRTSTLPVAAPEVILHQGQWYIAALKPGLDGIRIARLKWSSP
jgi:hypothetical protein